MKSTSSLSKKIEQIEKISNELSLSEEYIRFIINSISFALISIDLNYNIAQYNKNSILLLNLDEIKKNKNLFEAIPYLKYRKSIALLKTFWVEK